MVIRRAVTAASTHIGVLDVGKTHVRLSVLDELSGELVWKSEPASAGPVQNGTLRSLDLASIERWLLDAMSHIPDRHRLAAIVPIAHGAAAVLLDQTGRPLYAPDYEDPQFDDIQDAYRLQRDPYGHTYSPFLPRGLNLGRQWFWLEQHRPRIAGCVSKALLYPQYWAWLLSGVAAAERTSLGCHSDLWLPGSNRFSELARRRGWDAWLPPVRAAGEVLGPIRSEVALRTGVSPTCEVLCGIHDSNASYLCHLERKKRSADPFAVISSGTWTVVFASAGKLERLQESSDMLANVDAHGSPVATARFMGGREFAAIAGPEGAQALPSWRGVRQVLSKGCFAIPSFAAGGPFAANIGRIEGPSLQSPDEQAALATLYVALMAELLLEKLDASGPCIVDGPLASNTLFGSFLSVLGAQRHVLRTASPAGAVQAARVLRGQALDQSEVVFPPPEIAATELGHYRDCWRHRLAPLAPHD